MVERFHGRILEMLKQTQFTSSRELKQARYLRLDNHHISQSSLGYLTPVEALKKWQKSHPHLFKKSVYNEKKPDSYLYEFIKKYFYACSLQDATAKSQKFAFFLNKIDL